MVQSPSWEANWFAAIQEIPCISRNLKVHYCTHKRPPTVSIMGQPNPVRIPTSHLLEILTFLLTPWCRVLLEKLTGLQLVKKFPAFHGTRWFITALTSFHHLSLLWASPIQSIYPHFTSWRSLLTYSMVQSPSWETNWFAASQEIPCISRNLKVHYCTHKRLPPVSIMGQPKPVHIPTSHLLDILTYLLTYLLHGAESFLRS